MKRLTTPILALAALIALPCIAAAEQAGQPDGIDDGLIGYWPFDEATGNRVLDASGHGSDGEIVNGARVEGVIGGAVSLSGKDNAHVSIAGTAILDRIADGMTVTAWVWPTVAPDTYRVVVSRQIAELAHPDQFYLGFGLGKDGMHYKWHIGTIDGGEPREANIYVGEPDHGRWIHMAGTYDGEMIRLYVDGKEIGHAKAAGRIRVDDNPVTIAGEENGSVPRETVGNLDGRVDEVRLYDRALAPEEIAAVFEAGRR